MSGQNSGLYTWLYVVSKDVFDQITARRATSDAGTPVCIEGVDAHAVHEWLPGVGQHERAYIGPKMMLVPFDGTPVERQAEAERLKRLLEQNRDAANQLYSPSSGKTAPSSQAGLAAVRNRVG